MKKVRDTGWAITGDCGIYVGWWQTRAQAIAEHVVQVRHSSEPEPRAFFHERGLTPQHKKIWERCKRNGDRCIKVEIREI